MATNKLEQAMEDVYTSIHNDNENLDECIKSLKAALTEEGTKTATFEPERLAMNNRQGRKMMQTYFKKRGVIVAFDKGDEGKE